MRTRTTTLSLGATAALALAIATPVAADSYRFSVVARNLDRPVGIAVDGSEVVYFTEVPEPGTGGGANGVSSLDLETGVVTRLNSGEPEPTNLALDREGDLYWTCKSAGVILRLAEGAVAPFATGLEEPSGIAIGRRGAVYITEIPNPGVAGARNRVSVIRGDDKIVLSTGEPEPTDVAVARNGDLYWTCKSAGVILRLAEGAVAPFATDLEEPSGIAIGRGGAVYITEIPDPGVAGAGNRVSVIRGDDKIVLSSGEPEPTDVAVARNGDLYWTCKSAGVILERSNGKVSVFRDNLDHPSGIAIDHKGETLYFTEVPTPGVPGDQGGRNRVRAIDLRTGALRTIHMGDPEPTDVAVARNGNLYWTCTSAGVIVEARRRGGRRDRD